jgi:hypothetical protein
MGPVQEILHGFTRAVVLSLMIMMMFAVAVSTVELLIILIGDATWNGKENRTE